MSSGVDRHRRVRNRDRGNSRAGDARDEQTDFRADPESLALADANEEAQATTWRVTLTGVEMAVEPIQGYARGTSQTDALRRVDPSTIPADLDDVDMVGMVDYRAGPTPDEEDW